MSGGADIRLSTDNPTTPTVPPVRSPVVANIAATALAVMDKSRVSLAIAPHNASLNPFRDIIFVVFVFLGIALSNGFYPSESRLWCLRFHSNSAR